LTRNEKNGNGVRNGNGKAPYLGVCPICGDFEIISFHHLYPRWIWPEEADEHCEKMGRGCHDEEEVVNKKLEAAILRLHSFAFEKTFNEFKDNGGRISDERIEEIALQRAIGNFSIEPPILGSKGRLKIKKLIRRKAKGQCLSIIEH